ncbi:MAG: hypothetical protein PHS59_10380 [Paludibacter sp.]|nr:hypothetical protein [Paludibacter sp.]
MKNKKILIISLGTFTVISLVLALILSPLRSYNSAKLNILDESKAVLGVEFNGKIKNAREALNNQYMPNSSLNIVGNKTSSKEVSKTQQNTGAGTHNNVGSGVTAYNNYNKTSTNGATNAFSSEGNSSNKNSKSVSPSNINIGMLSSTPTNNNTKKTSFNNGVASLTTDLTKASGVSTKFSVDGGPPPSEDNGDVPPTPSLPIGDGMNFLLVLAVVFTGVKAKRILLN